MIEQQEATQRNLQEALAPLKAVAMDTFADLARMLNLILSALTGGNEIGDESRNLLRAMPMLGEKMAKLLDLAEKADREKRAANELNALSELDVLFGPKVKELSFKFLGSRNACELKWECAVHLPECPDARYELGLMELGYRTEFHTRRDGTTGRVVSDSMKIPNNRLAPNATDVLDLGAAHRPVGADGRRLGLVTGVGPGVGAESPAARPGWCSARRTTRSSTCARTTRTG